MNWMLIVKYALSAALIVGVSELVKYAKPAGTWLAGRLPWLQGTGTAEQLGEKLAALIAALPFVTILIMIWIFIEGKGEGEEKIASHAWYTFWFVLPTLPMFLLLAWMLNRGMNFWLSLGSGILLTFVCFALTALLSRPLGLKLW